jgi:D-3-phosphoglycerate dehydrogenase
MKILLNDGLCPNGQKILTDNGFEIDTKHYDGEELIEKIAEFDGIIVRSATKVTKAVIDAGVNLKAIARAGTGIDNIDHNYAKSKNIPVLNTPGANSASVSELVFAHFFALARFLPESKGSMAMGEWNKKKFKGFELAGKTVGIIGFGRIGTITARMALAFGMKVLVYDVMEVKTDMDVTVVSKDELLKNSDFITIHVPKLDKPFIGEAELKMMKKSAYIVNCSRGGVIDESALLTALNNEEIAGAGLDVWINEPDFNLELVKHPKVSPTPHIGANTYDALDRVGMEIARKMVAELKK